MPKVSVVIPCYNHGQFVGEAIDSVFAQTFRDFEVIVVNDGSSDPLTNEILDTYDEHPIRLIRTQNQGLVHARNTGIRAAGGEYILPLDADDRIGASYMEKAVAVLDANPAIGIVYCEAELFGAKTGKWELPEYKFPEFLIHNVIFCSAFFRRDDWEAVNGYNPNMIYGFEDHDFWLSLIELGREVHRIPETSFYYRQRPESMIHSITPERLAHVYTQMSRNHPRLYADNMGTIVEYVIGLHTRIHDLMVRVAELEQANALATR